MEENIKNLEIENVSLHEKVVMLERENDYLKTLVNKLIPIQVIDCK